jgi:isopentenyl diphosphate isomerase/L-lactate dehydrogenase-like FMN-dependent dehydrogenase
MKENSMDLTDLYTKGEEALRQREIGHLLDGVETGFILKHDRVILDRYTFRQQCIDATEATTRCKVFGISLSVPAVMSAMTMPIPAIMDDGLLAVAHGLKEAGSLMWTGTPVPHNLRELVETGVPLAANVKPFKDRRKIFQSIDDIQGAGVQWMGIEIDSGQGTKIRDRMMASDCVPLALKELEEIRKRVSIPLVFKGVLSLRDALKAVAAGADAIVISNHGAHTLDYLPHPLQVMDSIVPVVGKKMKIFVDGGFRRGSDILKGLAFGASLVGLGRPILCGLAAAGKEGVAGVIDGVTQELRRIMTMVGAADPGQVRRDILIED